MRQRGQESFKLKNTLRAWFFQKPEEMFVGITAVMMNMVGHVRRQGEERERREVLIVTQRGGEVGEICQNNPKMKFGPEEKALDLKRRDNWQDCVLIYAWQENWTVCPSSRGTLQLHLDHTLGFRKPLPLTPPNSSTYTSLQWSFLMILPEIQTAKSSPIKPNSNATYCWKPTPFLWSCLPLARPHLYQTHSALLPVLKYQQACWKVGSSDNDGTQVNSSPPAFRYRRVISHMREKWREMRIVFFLFFFWE